jgi:hypothetical protein
MKNLELEITFSNLMDQIQFLYNLESYNINTISEREQEILNNRLVY